MKVFEYGNQSSQAVLIQLVDENERALLEGEVALIRENTEEDFLLRAYQVENWNADLSPWKAPAVFGKEDFGDGAQKTLSEVLEDCRDDTRNYYIGGYSLAGLFAIWCAYQTSVFRGVAAASPSIWFPGFVDYMKENEIRTDCVYLSLGDKEAKTRNPVMAAVADRMQEAYELLQRQNVSSFFEWNQGNHFREPDLRTAKAFAWVLNH